MWEMERQRGEALWLGRKWRARKMDAKIEASSQREESGKKQTDVVGGLASFMDRFKI